MVDHSQVDHSRFDHGRVDPSLASRSRSRSASRAPRDPVAGPVRTVFAHPVLTTPQLLQPVDWVAATGALPAVAVGPARVAAAGRPSLRGGVPSPLIPLAVCATLLLAATLVAPERPALQEAICQRHNGVAACRVW